MKKEKFKEVFSEAMNELDERYIAETEDGRQRKQKKPAGRIVVLSIVGLAAAAAVAIGIFALWDRNGAKNPGPDINMADDGQNGSKNEHGASESDVKTGDGHAKNDTETEPPAGHEDNDTETEPPAGHENNDTETEPSADRPLNAALVKAVYPPRAKMTSENDYNDTIYQEEMERGKLANTYKGKLDEFYRNSLKAIITNAEEPNPIAAPANLYMALSLLAESAEGSTRAEILKAIGASSIEEARERANTFWKVNYQDNGKGTLRLANSIWLNAEEEFRKEKLETMRDAYFASVYQGVMADPAYEKAMQDWLNEETGGLLRDAVAEIKQDPRAIFSLLSTAYFNAGWAYPFAQELNEEGVFHGKVQDAACTFMRSDDSQSYYQGTHFGAIALPADGYTMFLFLPEEGMDVRALAEDEEALSLMIGQARMESYEEWKDRQSYPVVHLSLPKFDLAYDQDLKAAMMDMGIVKAFSRDEADFSGVFAGSQRTWLSKAQNDLRVAIDEEGITAVSIIQMEVCGEAMPEQEIDFRLDRPFFYCITSNQGTILFAGAVEQL